MPILARLLLVITLSLALTGCYLMQAAQGQLALMSKRKPVEKLLAQPQTDEKLRARLQRLAEAREFAVHELALPDNGSYRSYADLSRKYAVWNVFATEQFSVDPLQWCFPVAGCVVYRGYFHESAAERYALRSRMRGKDARVAGAAAYSTLGHFNDPIVSTMLRWSDAQVIATLFHELAHQVVYVPGDSAFNEAFASVVEEAGIERWLLVHGEAAALTEWRAARARGAAFSRLLLDGRERLRNLYRLSLPPAEMAYRKQLELGRIKYEYWQLKASWQSYAGYDYWFDRALNNADFVPIATYDACMPPLQALLKASNNDWPQFYAAVKAVAKESAKERAGFCAAAKE